MVNERVLVLDRDVQTRMTLGGYLTSLGYPHVFASDESDAIRKGAKENFAAAFIDTNASSPGAASPVERLQAICPLTVAIMMTASPSMAESVAAIRAGAIDYLSKPIDLDELSQALERALSKRRQLVAVHQQRRLLEMKIEQRTRELSGIYQETIQALGSALDTRDPETQEHAMRVVQYSLQIAQEIGVSGNELKEIERGAVLHDVGKIGVPDGILFKPGKLTPSEWSCMKTHTEIGYNMLNSIRFLRAATSIVRSHHERFDGKGYPDGISAASIPIGARIFAIADAVDAMTSDRPYSRARDMEAATVEILNCAGSQFDPDIVKAFQTLVETSRWEQLLQPHLALHEIKASPGPVVVNKKIAVA